MPDNNSGTPKPKRFRIAFSFAGEKREFVAKVARILADRFGENKILYDKFHEAEFAVFDLGIRLPKLYGEQSDLIVPVICPNYDEKRWTGWEWVHIYGLLTKTDGHRVMPSRFEYAQADGLSPASGFIELDNKTPEQFATLVLERLALNERLPKNYYTKGASGSGTRSAANIPNNLPRQQFFFGRADELKRIAESLSPDSRGWGALIDGPGGIGKTALAIRAAELVPAGRFKRIIFLSSKERELTADGQRALGQFVLPSYLEMLNAIAREIEQPDLTKSPEAERSDSILRALRESDVLLVLDNLETLPEPDRDQLFAFLNRLPRGCSGIVTSRRRADASAIAVRLDKLDWPAARDLLAGIAQDNERLRATPQSQWRALYDETGGNPLLLRWVAGQLGLGRCKTIPDAVERLRNPAAQNNPLEFIFGDLLDTFTANETKVLAALTHFTSQVAVMFIAELAGINVAAAQGALSDLSSRALVLPDLEERNFALVPMVADYLRRKKPEVVQETGDRLERKAYALVVENGYDKHDRFPVLDAAWPTVAAALPRFLAGENGRLQIVCNALTNFLEFTGRWDEHLALSRDAEPSAMASEDFVEAGWRAHRAGWVHYLRGQSAGVLACADRAEAHWREAKTGAGERAFAIHLRGLGHRLAEDYPAAIAAFREAVELWRSLGPEGEDVAIGLNSLAVAERLDGDLDGAERDYGEALRIARASEDREGIATYSCQLALLALDREDWPSAEALAREALPLSEKVGRNELIAWICLALAKALVLQEKKEEGLRPARCAVEIFQKLGHPDLAAAQQILDECNDSDGGSD